MQNMEWYYTLNKPALTPPDVVFGYVWPVLYFMMFLALYIMVRQKGEHKIWGASALFLVQLGLNLMWSPLFFTYQNIGGALLLIVVLWGLIGFTVRAFGKISAAAAWLLVPYWLWVSFAVYLNFEIWRLN